MPDPQKLADASAAAVVAEKSTGVPASIFIAQWAIESGWGANSPGQNCFGIKSYTGEYGRQLLKTTEFFTAKELAFFLSKDPGRTATIKHPEVPPNAKGRREYAVMDWFSTFPNLAACFERRAKLFDLGRYKPLTEQFRKDGDVTAFVKAFSVTYATDPKYGELILKILGQRNVTMALAKARTATGPVDA